MSEDKKIDDGGPAFPQMDSTEHEFWDNGYKTGAAFEPHTFGGATMLDWFAGQATDDDIKKAYPEWATEACNEFMEWVGLLPKGSYPKKSDYARLRAWARYEFAAAMIAEKRSREANQ